MLNPDGTERVEFIGGRRKIRIVPEQAAILTCSKCGASFADRGIIDYSFVGMQNGVPIFELRSDVLCDECKEEQKREEDSGNYIRGPLNNTEV